MLGYIEIDKGLYSRRVTSYSILNFPIYTKYEYVTSSELVDVMILELQRGTPLILEGESRVDRYSDTRLLTTPTVEEVLLTLNDSLNIQMVLTTHHYDEDGRSMLTHVKPRELEDYKLRVLLTYYLERSYLDYLRVSKFI